MKFRILGLLALPTFLLLTHQAEAAEPALTRAEFVERVIHDVYPHDTGRNCFRDIAPSLPPTYRKLFADVAINDPHAESLCLGIEFGLLDGDRDARFRPNDPINVAEAAKIMTLAYGIDLPDSLIIRHLGWHWRYTESLKRHGILAHSFTNYQQGVTAAEAMRMLDALRPVRPALLKKDITESDRSTDMQNNTMNQQPLPTRQRVGVPRPLHRR